MYQKHQIVMPDVQYALINDHIFSNCILKRCNNGMLSAMHIVDLIFINFKRFSLKIRHMFLKTPWHFLLHHYKI